MSDINPIADNSAEQHVLSAMLIRNGECIPAVTAILSDEDFYSPRNRIAFRTIAKLYSEGTSPNLISVMDELRKTGELEKIGVEYVFALDQWESTNAYAVAHAKIVKEKSKLRHVQMLGEQIAQDAAKGILLATDIIAEATTNFGAITDVNDEKFNSSSINDCLDTFFLPELENLSHHVRLSTGFENFDNAQILLPGLYLIGAEPAIGKTDFIWQLLEQMSRVGCKCVYASYEMNRMAMLRRTVAREIFKHDVFTVLSASNLHENLKYPEHQKSIVDAMTRLNAENLDLRIIELYGQNIDSLIRRLNPLRTNDKPFVVAIDYLQVLAAATNPDNPKIAVDECLRKLKSFQNDTGAVMFVVSSFNRANYRIPVSYASFKESGSCEYFADVMLGLQLYAVNKITGKEKSAVEVSELIDEAFKMQPRQIQLRCIKNRNGSVYDLYFRYHSANSFFDPCTEQDFIADEIPANITDKHKTVKE